MDRKRKSWKFPWLLVILILSLCLNLFLILSPGGLTEQQQDVDWRTIKEINKPGTYGPSGRELVEGNLTICTAGLPCRIPVRATCWMRLSATGA